MNDTEGAINRDFQRHLEAVLKLSPNATAISARGADVTWGQLAQGAARVSEALSTCEISEFAPVGWSAKNTPGAVVAFLGIVLSGRMVVPLRPGTISTSFGDDIRQQQLQAVVAGASDWNDVEAVAKASAVGTIGLSLDDDQFRVEAVPGLEKLGEGPFRREEPDLILERLTSGTTGAPKRVPVSRSAIIPSLHLGDPKQAETPDNLTLKPSPALLFKPFSHAGGLFGLLLALFQARPIVLFEKFNVEEWVAAVAAHKPKVASLVPAMIQMILDAQPEPSALSSLRAVRSGTAPLDPDLQTQFQSRYNIPILVDYGAAEFVGGLAGWTLEDHKQYAAEKLGSVGRVKRGVELRVVDAETFAPLPANSVGLVEVKSDRFGGGWIRTNDLARFDSDGFLFLQGRADQAINRGGFKIQPEEVEKLLKSHPDVVEAAVLAKSDKRLGQVPVAVIEVAKGATMPAPETFDELVRANLPAYMVPTEYHALKALPRTNSMKVSRAELRKLMKL
ncbi:MAG: class I adenylate-forming enzyme family protein [Luminiphilus sp.]|jgi:long-chain acyl-CoA synthetase